MGLFQKLPGGVQGLPSGACYCVIVSRFFRQKLPGGTNCWPGDSSYTTQFLDFIWTAWRWWTTVRRRELLWLKFGVFRGFWAIVVREDETIHDDVVVKYYEWSNSRVNW